MFDFGVGPVLWIETGNFGGSTNWSRIIEDMVN